MKSEISIIAELDLNPDVCVFNVEYSLYLGTARFMNREEAETSLLAREVFGVGGVAQIMVSEQKLTVVKSSELQWSELGRLIGAVIRRSIQEHQEKKQPLVSESAISTDSLEPLIQKLLDSEVNPSVASHGGKITLVEVKDLKVYLQMSGGCQGCSSAKHTLKDGVEKTIRGRFPQVREIVDVTDHRMGKMPYLL